MSGEFDAAVLDRMPLAARTVLEVGCGDGHLAAAYKARNPAARIWGIEPTATPVAGSIDVLARIDAQTQDLPSPPVRMLDCVVFNNTLQGFHDPLAVLRRQCERLAEDGVVVISLPNLEHWSFVARLLNGSFEYGGSELFAHSNLHWYTARGFRRLLDKAALLPRDVTPRFGDRAGHAAFVEHARPLLETLQVNTQDYAMRSAPLQLIWRAGVRPAERLNIAAHMLPPQGGVSHVRIAHPLLAVASDADVTVRFVSIDALPEPDPALPRILLLHRLGLSGPHSRDLLRRVIAQGTIVIMEYDDHPDYFANLQTEDNLSFRGVHAVQTTTPLLAQVFRQRNPNVGLFPNAVRALPQPCNFRNPDRLCLFFGAFNREADWRALLPSLVSVAHRVGPRLHFEIMHDQMFFETLPLPNKSFQPMADYDTYLATLAQAEFCFMPLSDTPFNRAKSDLKFLEAAASRVVPLASRTVYEDSIVDGETGLLFSDARELENNLLWLFTAPANGQAIADKARAEVTTKRMLAYQVADRIAWYRDLWANREQLTQELYARAPELRPD